MSVVAALVPTFRPDADALMSLVSTLAAAGVPLLIADDASPCTSDPVLRRAEEAGARVLRHRTNRGIARSLNDGLAFASSAGATWLLTVDQDSRLVPDYVSSLTYGAAAATAALGPGLVGAVAAGTISDASGAIAYRLREASGVLTTEEVIQTGTLWSTAAIQEIGGFDESLGIDAVDAAACVRLRASGRHIVVVPEVTIAHQLGESRQVRILGRTVLATGHGPERRATIVRNRLRLAPEEFRQSPAHAIRTIRRVVMGTALAVTVEDDRWAKAKASIRGLLPRSGE